MKKLLTLSFLLLSLFAQAQEKKKNISFSYGFGDGQIFMREDGVGGPSLEGKKLNTIGVNYGHELTKNLFIETGIGYLNYSYESSPAYPGAPKTVRPLNTKLLTIPVKLRCEFAKYFYVNGGAFLGLNLKENETTNYNFSGLGATVGLGAHYYFTKQLGIFVNPQLNFHGLLISAKESNYLLSDATAVFGLAYRIK